MKDEGRGRKERRNPARLRAAGWSRLAMAIALLAAVIAVIAWNSQPPEQVAAPVVKDKPLAKPSKPLAAADPRDTARDRPDRERTSR
jgi:hypothetical protein